jgi:membrane protein
MRKKLSLVELVKKTASQFIDDNGLKLSAAMSYYTIFALAPVLIIVMSLAGFFFDSETVHGKIFGKMALLVGDVATHEVEEIIQNIQHTKHSVAGAIIGVIALIIGATGVFTEIQDSINYVWCIKVKPEKGWLKLIMNRLLSFSLIVSLGFILLVSLLLNALLDILSDRLKQLFSAASVYIYYGLDVVGIFVVIATMFAIIFKVLPDAKIKWKDAFIGAFFTACLFALGKFLIEFYLSSSGIGLMYGTAASVILILLWVYYSSIILFLGAEFTHVYATHNGGGVTINDTAVFIVKQESKETKTLVM